MRLRALLGMCVVIATTGCGDDVARGAPGGGGSTATSGGGHGDGGEDTSAGGSSAEGGRGPSTSSASTSGGGSGGATSSTTVGAGGAGGAGGEEPAPTCGDPEPTFDDPMDACRAWLAEENTIAEAIGGCGTMHDGVCGGLEDEFSGCEAEGIAVHACLIAGACPATCTCDEDGALSCVFGCEDEIDAFVACFQG